jgi:hypothetical protein
MTPDFNKIDSSLGDTITSSNRSAGFTSCQSSLYYFHGGIGKFCLRLFSADGIAALLNHVCCVVLCSSFKKVLRIYAATVITLVKRTLAALQWCVVQFPRNSMSFGQFNKLAIWLSVFSTGVSQVKDTVAVSFNGACPIPARISFFYVAPKALFKCCSLGFACTLPVAKSTCGVLGLEFCAAVGTFKKLHSSFFTVLRRGASDILASLTSPTLTP